MKFALEIDDVGHGVSVQDLAEMLHRVSRTIYSTLAGGTTQTAMDDFRSRGDFVIRDGGGNVRGHFGFAFGPPVCPLCDKPMPLDGSAALVHRACAQRERMEADRK